NNDLTQCIPETKRHIPKIAKHEQDLLTEISNNNPESSNNEN
ncbi:20206_t:CDS:1, partial [Gigaspora rosea]